MDSSQTPGNPRKIAKILTIAVLILLGLFVAAFICVSVYWNSLLNRMRDAAQAYSEPETSSQSPEIQPEATAAMAQTEFSLPEMQTGETITNILLIGQNQNLADSMILCSVNRASRQLTLVSFLRDLYVPIPAYAGHGPDKNRINACYYWGRKWSGTEAGGMELLTQCIEQNFGVPVKHCVCVDFSMFPQVIDAIGGVEIDLTEKEAQYLTKEVGYVGSFQPGIQTLTGTEALAYSRIRKIDSDIQRTRRQRNVLTSAINKCRSLGVIQLHELALNVMPMIATNMTNGEITAYLWELLPMVQDLEVRTGVCPVDNETLPGSCWDKQVKIGGTDCAVIACSTSKNREYLLEFLGYDGF